MWLHKVGEPPGEPNHNISYDHDIIEICSSCNGAILEALRHDCFDYEEVWDQYEWYEVGPADGLKLRAIAARCERPLDPFCDCDAHKSLRTSARELPRASVDAVFESVGHRHVVTVSDGPTPRFALSPEGTELLRVRKELEKQMLPPPTDQAKSPDAEAVGFIFIAWPATLAASIWAWMRWVRLPWYVDTVVIIVAIPATFVIAGMAMAAGKVIYSKYNK